MGYLQYEFINEGKLGQIYVFLKELTQGIQVVAENGELGVLSLPSHEMDNPLDYSQGN